MYTHNLTILKAILQVNQQPQLSIGGFCWSRGLLAADSN